jgi:hypothetical protein
MLFQQRGQLGGFLSGSKKRSLGPGAANTRGLRIAQHVAKRAGQHHDSANQVRRVYRRLRGRNDLVMTTIMVMLLSLRLNLAE